MLKPWVKETGICSEEELSDAIGGFEFEFFTACCTDRIVTAAKDRLQAVLADRDRILELRLFGEKAELLFFRSMQGRPFSFRRADEEGLCEIGSSPLGAECWFEIKQKLDIDLKNPPTGTAEFGGKLLRATGGGVYELPIGDEDALVLVKYASCDENGAMHEVDFRMKGFGMMEESNE